MDVYEKAKRRIFEYAFGNSYSSIYDIISHRNSCRDLEFELRLADHESHCSIDSWNIYDDYLISYTPFMNDVIVTYKNPSFDIRGKIYREYRAGNVFQEKSLISKFKGENELNTVPLVAKLSFERYLPTHNFDIRSCPDSYARTYRQSFRIQCGDLSESMQRYLSNWSVDKTIRQISKRADDFKIQNEIKLNIDEPSVYDILDIEFEYDAEYDDFEMSLIALIEFLYLTHPTLNSYYRSVSYEYQLYSILCRDQLESLVIAPEIKHSDSKFRFHAKDGSRLMVMVYINDKNYFLFDKSTIDFGAFSDIGDFNFNVYQIIYSGLYIALDAYFINKNDIRELPYEERYQLMKKTTENSSIIRVEDYNSQISKNEMTIYMHDNYKLIKLVPVTFHIDLALKPHRDGLSYTLYTKDNIPLVSPLLAHLRYTPTRLDVGLSFNRNMRFNCVRVPGAIELVPIKNTNNVDTLNDACSIILEAFATSSEVADKKAEEKAILYLFQAIIERYNVQKYKNVYMYMPHEDNFDKCLKLISDYISYDKLIIKTTTRSVIDNLISYYSNEFITPIKRDTRIVKSSNLRIYMLNEERELYSIPEVFRTDMNLILTNFIDFKDFNSLMKVFETLKENVTENGIVVINYINKHNDLFEFINGSNVIDLTKETNIRSAINSLIKTKSNSIIKYNKHLTTKGLELIHQHGSILYYRIKNRESNELESEAYKTTSKLIQDEDLVLQTMKLLSSKCGFSLKTYYPLEDDELASMIAYNKSINDEFKTDIDYSNYVSLELTF